MRRISGFLVFLAAVVAGGWWYLSAPMVDVARPTRGPAVEAVYATGVVEPVSWAKVTPKVAGRLVELCQCEGTEVTRGTVLARMDDAAERARLNELIARASFLEKEVERYSSLVAHRNASLQTLERTISEHGQAIAAVAVARERLEDMTLRAPLDGVVLRRDGEVGEVVEPGAVLFWIGQPEPLWVETMVDEEDIPRLRLGQRVLIKADAFPGRALEGSVERITPIGDPVNKNFRIYVRLPDGTPLMIGMTAEVNIVVATVDNALLVPAEAVRRGRVVVFDNGRGRVRAVETGITGDRLVEIKAGLADDDVVILAPPADLADGGRVRTRAAAGAER